MLWLTLLLSTAFGFTLEQTKQAFHSTVLIQQPGETHCSGVLISEDTVLVAAHCIDTTANLKDIQVSLHILDKSKSNSVFMKDSVQTIKLHPQFNSKKHPVDLALLKLTNTIPQKLNDARIHFDLSKAYDSYQPQALLMGYGITAKARVSAKQFEKESLFPQIRGKTFDLKSAQNSGDNLVLDNRTAQACSGDSGGPLIALTISGAMRLLGIITKVLANPIRFKWDKFIYDYKIDIYTPNQVCTGKAVFLNIGNYRSWIEEASK